MLSRRRGSPGVTEYRAQTSSFRRSCTNRLIGSGVSKLGIPWASDTTSGIRLASSSTALIGDSSIPSIRALAPRLDQGFRTTWLHDRSPIALLSASGGWRSQRSRASPLRPSDRTEEYLRALRCNARTSASGHRAGGDPGTAAERRTLRSAVDCAIGVQFLVIILAHRSHSRGSCSHTQAVHQIGRRKTTFNRWRLAAADGCTRRQEPVTALSTSTTSPPWRYRNIGDTRTVELRFGTGSIQQGTKLTITSFQFNLDCNSNDPLPPLHRRGPPHGGPGRRLHPD